MTNIKLVNDLNNHQIKANHMTLDQLEEKEFKFWHIEVMEL